MSTRANIGILRKNGVVECVYSHSDGYPEYLGNLLLDHYTDKEDTDKTRQMVEMILSLGDVSFLEEKLQNSRFYNSWRNEGTKSKYYASLKEYITNLGDSWIEYSYLWDEINKKWIYARYTDEFMVWTELLHTKEEGGEQNA